MKKIFKTALATLSIIYMIASVTISVQLIMGMSDLGRMIIEKTGLKISDKFKGGRVDRINEYDGYISRVHKPVFEGPFGESSEGFIQIDWFTDDSLPAEINEEFDYDQDGKIDFKLKIWPHDDRAFITAYDDRVMNLVDKATVASFTIKGYPDGRNAVFSFKDYEESLFLGYSMDEVNSLDKVKKLLPPEYQAPFEEYITAAREDRAIEKGELIIIDGMDGSTVPVTISYHKDESEEHTQYKVLLKTGKTKGRQQLLINVRPGSDYVTIYPKTSYKLGKSVRVMLKNNRR